MPGYYVPSKTDDDTFTSGDYTRYMRENFRQGVPGIFNNKGDIAAASEIRRSNPVSVGEDYNILAVDSSADGLVRYQPVAGFIGQSGTGLYGEDGVTYTYGDWTNILYDSHGFYDVTKSTETLVIPDGQAGTYLVQFYLRQLSSTASSDYTIKLSVSGGVKYSAQWTYTDISAGGTGVRNYAAHAMLNVVAPLIAGHRLMFRAKQDGYIGDGIHTGVYMSYPYVRLLRIR